MNYVPTSPIIRRGSAPKGTFQIPDEGLRISHADSFLSRFWKSRSASKPTAERGSDTSATPVTENANSSRSSSDRHLHAKSADAEEIAASVTKLNISSNSTPADDSSRRAANGTRAQENAHASKVYKSEPSKAQKEVTSTVTESFSAPIAVPSVQQKTAEQEADEVEDTLINVISDTDSLLYDGRPSYPTLRFCAAKGLLDQQALEHLGLPLGFIWSPFGELNEVARISRPAKRCGTCGSFVAKGNGAGDVLNGSRLWTCDFCGRNDNDAGEAGLHANITPHMYPELSTDTVEYLHPQSMARSSAGRGAIILIVDENVNPDEAEWTRAAVAAVRTSASQMGLRFALLSIGAGCSVAVRSEGETEPIPTVEMMSVARASKLGPEEKERFFLQPPKPEEVEAATADGDTPDQYSSVTDPLIAARARTGMAVDEAEKSAVSEATGDEGDPENTRLPSELESRRLDIAIFIAFELIAGMADSENSRILSLITGPPTLAEPALKSHYTYDRRDKGGKAGAAKDMEESYEALGKLYEQVGSRAGDMRIALDFLCFGAPSGFGGEILLGAARRSRGGLVYSAAHSFSAASALAEAASFLTQRSTNPGVVSIRVSSPLSVARVIGPAFPTAAPHTYAVPGIDPTTGFTIILKAKSGIEAERDVPSHAVLQLAAKSLRTTRVVTARIPVTKVASEYLASLDSEICALILGKACIVSGGALTQPAIAIRSIDASVKRLLEGSEAVAGVARLMFELRRGLLLGNQVDPDCSLVLRSFFLRAECAVASLLLSPRLFTNSMSDENTGLMAEVPLEKSYVTDGAVLVLDTGFNVFVYVGSKASAEAEEAISESARSVAAQRISPCQLWKLRPGRDADYLLDSYLSPAESRKGSPRLQPVDQGFLPYCVSLAPESKTVLALRTP